MVFPPKKHDASGVVRLQTPPACTQLHSLWLSEVGRQPTKLYICQHRPYTDRTTAGASAAASAVVVAVKQDRCWESVPDASLRSGAAHLALPFIPVTPGSTGR